jgi:hypothetical protein
VYAEKFIRSVPNGPLGDAIWSRGDTPGEWFRAQYRVSDDAAEQYGHPYIIAWMRKGEGNFGGAAFHFFRWQCYSEATICLGDTDNLDYPFAKKSHMVSTVNWVISMQLEWCGLYHHAHDCGAPPDQASDEKIKAHLAEIFTAISKKKH